MRHRRRTASVLVVVAGVIAAVLASTALAASPAQRASSASAQAAPGSADTEYVRMMIPHHYQAIVMTRLAPERSADENLLELADRINVAQGVEIDAMRGWQGRNGLPRTDAEESYQRVLEDPALLEQMGMATPAEMDQLRAARGNDFDVLFLQLMIPHHEGAITMSEQILGTGSDTYVRQLAMDIISTQTDQNRTMREMLEAKTAE